MAKPKLIAFDLDYTLWPFWVDTHVDAPFTKKPNGKIVDKNNKVVTVYDDVPEILEQLTSEGYKLAAASRTNCPEAAKDLLKVLDWEKYFHYKEIYPGCKINHFKRFKMDSHLEYKDMLFFDDEYRNIKDVDSLGVTCIEVESSGLTKAFLSEGFTEFAKKNS